MFANNDNLKTLHISGFDMSGATDVEDLFSYNPKLETIYADKDLSIGADAAHRDTVFTDCSTKLVGGQGTKWSESNTDGSFAKVDGGRKDPGYFTLTGALPYTGKPDSYAFAFENTFNGLRYRSLYH